MVTDSVHFSDKLCENILFLYFQWSIVCSSFGLMHLQIFNCFWSFQFISYLYLSYIYEVFLGLHTAATKNLIWNIGKVKSYPLQCIQINK